MRLSDHPCAVEPGCGKRFHEESMIEEKDPTGKKPNEAGAKLDAGKIMASLLLDFAEALEEVAKVSTAGARKYTRGGWQTVPNGIERYDDAKWRHILKQRTEGIYDADFAAQGYPDIRHDAQEIWNSLAALTLRKRAEKAQAAGEDVPAFAVPAAIGLAAPGTPVRNRRDHPF